MKLLSSATVLLSITSLATSLSVSNRHNALSRRNAELDSELVEYSPSRRFDEIVTSYLEKRRGGGGSSGGGGGGGGGGGRSGGSSSSSSSGSSSGSRGSSGGSSGSRSTSSSVRPSYGGGKYYGGGATSAYSAGRRSPLGILPIGLAIGAAALFWPAWGAYGAYNYPYNHPYSFRNGTGRRNNTNTKRADDQNVTLPVTCLCREYSACGCDDNDDPTYLNSVIGDGTNLNSSLVHIGPVNGTDTITLNGTLPNDTDTSDSSTGGSSSTISHRILEASGIWVIGGVVAAIVMLL